MGLLTSAVMCMALNIYNEARGEPIEGQYAVADVTLQRVKDNRWEDTVCGVVYEDYQFSWTLSKFTVREGAALDLAIKIAEDTLSVDYKVKFKCADHYYNPSKVNPYWAKHMKVEAIIGNHKFLCSED